MRIARGGLSGLLAQSACLAVVFIIFISFCDFLLDRYWSDSEIWGVRVASLCFSSWGRYACGLKPLFNALLGTMDRTFPGQSIVQLMATARSATVAFWAASLFLALAAGLSPYLLLCFVGSSVFLLDASVARSDFWALPFLFLHLLSLRRLERGAAFGRRLLPALFYAVAAIMMTPKAIVTVAAFLPFWLPFVPELREQVKRRWPFFPLLFLLGLDWPGAGQFFFRLFSQSEYGASFWSATRFHFLERVTSENPQIFIAVAIFLALIGFDFFKNKQLPGVAAQSALLVLFGLVLFPDKLPFWLGSQTLVVFCLISPELDRREIAKRLVFVLALFSIANASHWLGVLRTSTNQAQLVLVQDLEDLIRRSPEIRVYDGIGIATSSGSSKGTPNGMSSFFLGPGQSELNVANIQGIKRERFDALIIPNKVKGFLFAMVGDISDNYVEASSDVFVRAIELEIKDPKNPGYEIARAALANFRPMLLPSTQLALIRFDEKRGVWAFWKNLSSKEIGVMPALCTDCQSMKVRISPLGAFFADPNRAAYSREFAFEPQWSRQPLLSSLWR